MFWVEAIKKPSHFSVAGLHRCSADSVELDPPTVLLYWGSSQRKHSLLPGARQPFCTKFSGYGANLCLYALFTLLDVLFSSQFFADVNEAQDKIKKMQESMRKKYSCDRSTTTTRLEDLLQDAAVSTNCFLIWNICFDENIHVNILFIQHQEEKEQLTEFKTIVTNLNKRAKSVIQLKPRNPTTPIKGKLPVQAVCDFKQQEVRATACLTTVIVSSVTAQVE